MNGTPYYFYADAETKNCLYSGRPQVLLLGSYQGCSNFGDILQLKGAIGWHQRQTRLEPVIFVNAYSLSSDDFVSRLREWFGIKAVVLWTEEYLDSDAHKLEFLNDPPVVDHLHLYGGGFLNSYWGERMLRLTEAVYDTFGARHYVISGQQVEPEFAPRLARHVERCRPILAGGRDRASADVLAACGAKGMYSFDDAAEAVRDLAGRVQLRREGSPGLAVHLNASSYTTSGVDGAVVRMDRLTRDLRYLLEHVRSAHGPDPEVTALNACSDSRVNDIKDTLSVLLELEDRFPVRSYRVLDLAKVALEYGLPSSNGAAIDLPANLGLVCSYHTAMFCNLAGLPVYLECSNEYYRQKSAGLSMNGGLETFLQHPAPVRLEEQLQARGPWLTAMEEAYARAPGGPVRERKVSVSTSAPRPWPFRNSHWAELRQMTEAMEAQRNHVQEITEARDRLGNELQQQRGYIAELSAARDSLVAEAAGMRGRIAELEQARDLLDRDIQVVRTARAAESDALRARIADLEQVRDREARHAGLRAAALRAENDYLRETLAALGASNEELRVQILELRKDQALADHKRLGLRVAALEAENRYLRERVSDAHWWRELARLQLARARRFRGRLLSRLHRLAGGSVRRAKDLARPVVRTVLRRV